MINIKFTLENNNYILTDTFKKSISLEKLINYSKIQATDYCFCRVDSYEVNETLFLGEITFTPFNSKIKYIKLNHL